MSYGQLLNSIPERLREVIRKYEGICKKLQSIKWSTEFNSLCLKEDILPKYSRIRHHDPAVAHTEATLKYRKYLVEREIEEKEKNRIKLEVSKEQCLEDIGNFEYNVEQKQIVLDRLEVILETSDDVAKVKTIKRLNNLYHGKHINCKDQNFVVKKNVDSFVNLSNYQLNNDEKRFLNLGLNCHLEPKYDKLCKKVELEILYQNLLQLESRNLISVQPELADQLRAESTKHRNIKHNSILTQSLKTAAQMLKKNPDITLRKADKSSTYVILNTDEYISKINEILSDSSKFKRISRNPIDKLKQKANKLIDCLNSLQGDVKLPKIIGDYKPGYIYGNVKTHKSGNPLRPIISQIPTPTYNLAKTINKIISPYIPNNYTLKSSNDFIDLLHGSKCKGIIASLDVESLFTNVPIDATIEIILEQAYNNLSLSPPKIPKEILRKLLELCTKEAPFMCPEGNLYVQTEGVAMGSPLGPTFANFYMGDLENRVFKTVTDKPNIYGRYVDDIFVQIEDLSQLIQLRDAFQSHSVLNFTYEVSTNGSLPFLDVLVKNYNDKFVTQVYHKPTDHGHCLNGLSECTDKYKTSVINNYLNRAYKLTETWQDFHTEILHIKQRLINNNYTNKIVDEQIKKFLEQKQSCSPKNQNQKPISVYYASQTHKNYKIEERIIKGMIYNNTECIDKNNKLQLIFYYRNKKNLQLGDEKQTVGLL